MDLFLTRVLLIPMFLSGCTMAPSGPVSTAELLKVLQSQVSPQRIEETVRTLVSFRTRQTFSSKSDRTGIHAARAWIRSQLADLLPLEEQGFEARNRFTGETTEGKNIVLTLRGTRYPDPVIVVGAHYDSLNNQDKTHDAPAPGADDNGSGTAMVMELARVLAPHRFERTVMLVLFDAEEHGLQGSKALARRLKEKNVPVMAMINNDIVGGDRSAGHENRTECRLFSAAASDETVRRLAVMVESLAVLTMKDWTVRVQETLDRPGRSGDHIPFHQAGFPAIRFIEMHENATHHHTPGDTVDHVNPDYAAQMGRINLAMIVSLATEGLPPAEPPRR